MGGIQRASVLELQPKAHALLSSLPSSSPAYSESSTSFSKLTFLSFFSFPSLVCFAKLFLLKAAYLFSFLFSPILVIQVTEKATPLPISSLSIPGNDLIIL